MLRFVLPCSQRLIVPKTFYKENDLRDSLDGSKTHEKLEINCEKVEHFHGKTRILSFLLEEILEVIF